MLGEGRGVYLYVIDGERRRRRGADDDRRRGGDPGRAFDPDPRERGDRADRRRCRGCPEPCLIPRPRVRCAGCASGQRLCWSHPRSSLLLLVAGPSLASPEPRGDEASGTSSRVLEPRRRLPAMTAPSIPDALSHALSRGRISEASYALERARSLFDLAGVRARFGHVARPDPRSATLVLRDLALRVGQLSARPRAIADRILARPTDGIGDPFDDGYTVSEEPPECSADVCVHYVATTDDAPDPDDLDISGVPDYVEAVLSVLDHVWAEEVDGLGYRAPKSDATSDNDGGSALLDVYLADIGVGGLYGYCASDDPHLGPPPYDFWDMSAYCVLDDDYDISQFGYPNPMKPLKVTAAHEFFHAVQFAYDIAEDGWFMESTATWMEEHVYDAINDNRQYLASSPLAKPLDPSRSDVGLPRVRHVDLLAVPHRVLRRRGARREHRSRGLEEGGRQRSGPGHVFDAGARRRGRGSDGRRDATGDSDGPSRTSRSGTPVRRRSTTRGARTRRRPSPDPRRSRGPRRSMHSTAKLDHLTNRFVVARPGSSLKADARLRVTVNGPPSGTGPEASVVVIRKSGAAGVQGRRLGQRRGRGGHGCLRLQRVEGRHHHDEREHPLPRLLPGHHVIRLLRRRPARPGPDLLVPGRGRLTRYSSVAVTGNGRAIGS